MRIYIVEHGNKGARSIDSVWLRKKSAFARELDIRARHLGEVPRHWVHVHILPLSYRKWRCP